MKRLRVRVELNRRKAGVPLEELVSVVEETQKFFHLLAEDVQIEAGRGVWLASDFDPESLTFTAEYDGSASTEQIRDFNAAFSGSSSLRQETIAQFTHIADLIEEDELVGFGLYQSDQETEPSDWRCLSRRDALRFANEIHLLAKSAGESASPLPAVNGSAGGRRLFKDRREREAVAADPSKRIRELESSLSRRIALLEQEVEAHSQTIRGIGAAPEASQQRLLQLIAALESFGAQAPKLLPEPAAREPLSGPTKPSARRWVAGILLAAAGAALAGWAAPEISRLFRPSHGSAAVAAAPVENPARSLTPTPAEPAPKPAPSPAAPPQSDAVVLPPRAALPVKTAWRPRVVGAKSIRQIALEVPPDLKSVIESEALVDVAVVIDEEGKVTEAKVNSTVGNGAKLLEAEALRAARRFRFRPAVEGKKPVQSQTVLNFVFEPESVAAWSDAHQP